MKIDDPKLTALALGELSGPEKKELETLLRDDPEASAFVAETAAFAELLRAEFHAEKPPLELQPAQRRDVIRQASEKVVPFRLPRLPWGHGIGALAASLTIALLFSWALGPLNAPREFAQTETSTPAASSSAVAMAAPAPAAAPVSKTVLDESATVALAAAAPMVSKDGRLADADAKLAAPAPEKSKVAATDWIDTFNNTAPFLGGSVSVAAAPAPAAAAATNEGPVLAFADAATELNKLDAQKQLQEAPQAPAEPIPGSSSGVAVSSGWVTVKKGEYRLRSLRTEGVSSLEKAEAGSAAKARANAPQTSPASAFIQTTQTPSSIVTLASRTKASLAERELDVTRQHFTEDLSVDGLLNAFSNEAASRQGSDPVEAECARCPWNPRHRLVRIRLADTTRFPSIRAEFAPDRVEAYRLLGDQPSPGPGEHTIRALANRSAILLYEIIPSGKATDAAQPLFTLKLDSPAAVGGGKFITQPVADRDIAPEESSAAFRFTAALAEFGMLLQGSPQMGSASWDQVEQLAASGENVDKNSRKTEFLELVRKAKAAR